MQKQVIADITASKGADVALKTTWHGEHHIFRFWFVLFFLPLEPVTRHLFPFNFNKGSFLWRSLLCTHFGGT